MGVKAVEKSSPKAAKLLCQFRPRSRPCASGVAVFMAGLSRRWGWHVGRGVVRDGLGELQGPTGCRRSCPPPCGLLLYLATTPNRPLQQQTRLAHQALGSLSLLTSYRARSGWWGVRRSGIKKEPAGRVTAAEPNAAPP